MVDEDGYRPFACPESGCSQSFSSEDRLFVHGITHHSHLSSITMPSFTGDQTPTPTKFLKNCEELGLFQEFTRNPFDEEFAKVAEQETSTAPTGESTEETGDMLSYASVPSNVENNDAHRGDALPPSDCSQSDDMAESMSVEAVGDFVSDNVYAHELMTLSELAVAVSAGETARLIIPVIMNLPNGQTVTVDIPADMTIPNIMALFGSSAVVAETDMTTAASVPTVAMAADYQDAGQLGLLSTVALPDLPAKSEVVSKPSSAHRESKGNSSVAPCIAPSTREKLKAAVQMMRQRGAMPEKCQSVTNAPGKLPLPPRSKCFQAAVGSTAASTSNVQLRAADTSTPCSQNTVEASSVSSEEGESSRRKFLERQRAAANRCRQKKKDWVCRLESKTNKMHSSNQRLQAEVIALREEARQLRMFLVGHRDCPAMTPDGMNYLLSLPQ